RTALSDAAAPALAAGQPIDPRFVRVQDYRPKAQPPNLGRSVGDEGPNQAGWWLDAQSDDEMTQLFLACGGGSRHLPGAGNVYQVAGQRWHRPWAPNVVLFGGKRSYRFGFDDRFSSDSNLVTRSTGEFLAAITVATHPAVAGRPLLANPGGLRVAGLPLIV